MNAVPGQWKENQQEYQPPGSLLSPTEDFFSSSIPPLALPRSPPYISLL